ncbi:heme peroxidase-domain-containing protein [Lasiosphaeris hirsuta]|uniref:Heme peroxidase-domain-containing protein n=1 Tax=Lasiosphaeris hirsuta TaxID=260670 RepID=A0AA40B193_9PEZI|nr:heme peroxidase-domain-containing protein [Lasiosphaeris hirsuta]
MLGYLDDFRKIFTFKNAPEILKVIKLYVQGQGLNMKAAAQIFGSLSINSAAREKFIESQVKNKYERMLHPPLTYLGGAFKYRTADGKFNSAIHPHLGQAGAPYAKTVPAITHPLGALPDPGDLFDRLMARETNRPSKSGLSSMLIYHATIIIHDIFRTNEKDKNISDTSSYLDLSPLYGFTDEMQRKVRDETYKLGLLKPDTFAEDRLLRQPPGVCIMLVMYNRYHNYAATQLRRINENGRFSVPDIFAKERTLAAAENFVKDKTSQEYKKAIESFDKAYKGFEANERKTTVDYTAACESLEALIAKAKTDPEKLKTFYQQYDAAWNKLDDDLFNTARLITCGMYIQVSIHDYLRALMGFHQYDTNFTLDPRLHETNAKSLTRGLGNQVTVEFNLLYRFHCAISAKDEVYTEEFMREMFDKGEEWNPKGLPLNEFMRLMGQSRAKDAQKKHLENFEIDPSEIEFGLETGPQSFRRNKVTGLFDDQQMVDALRAAMDDPISNFGPQNVPKSLKAVEIMGILQARKWEIGTLNDFREFFGLKRHATFEDISANKEVQKALRDLYEHPDKVELYPGVFCESDVEKNGDPGPSDRNSALWAAIFSDAITLVRSDRFYTVDWNVNSLTSWGMKEVTPDNDVLKSSVFHRLLQRAFPEWFPSDSVRFFHPFYTGQTNAQYAKEQGYDKGFKMETVHLAARDWLGRKKNSEDKDVFDITQSEPKKPTKPVYLKDIATIKAVLQDTSDVIVHPARLHLEDLPEDVQAVLQPRQGSPTNAADGFKTDSAALSDYFTGIARDIIKRELITIDPNSDPKVYQIDIARDFAIPVVTRYVADFLGFGHLVRTETNASAPYSENDIYQHITNCQVYLSYNSDETKLLKRRKAFKSSMKFLFGLTLKGHVATANRFFLTRKLRDAGRFCFGIKWNSMERLGLEISQTILQHENYKAGRAAAILLLVGLDNAYNTALAFNAVLSKFIGDLYKEAASATAGKEKPYCGWLQIQDLVFEEPANKKRGEEIEETIEHLILAAERQSVKIPIIRRAIEDHDVLDPHNPQRIVISVKKGQTIVCDYNPDVHPPSSPPTTKQNPANPWENTFFAHRSLFATRLAPYHPNHLRILSLRCMLTATATLRNLRRGHDTQGLLKRVRISASSEGYANYMAPQRVKKIAADVAREIAKVQRDAKLSKKEKEEQVRKWEGVYTERVLRPETSTYLTPEWDEMVPFPTTWKVRFDGFGWSEYGGRETLKALGRVDEVAKEFALMAPFYEAPGGESRAGGSFKTATCVCVGKESKCAAKVGEGEVKDVGPKKAPGARLWH